ncbi:MAG: hypothetical protein HY912_12585 [Desulfomonile tiedjei]|uniref:CobW/HypB/UreG nucleotide-binding domain-containing protein n=1 Tax=Desulfomonile tiedjei TaxID=2358 RepID=A0A9D6V408_9BACT|nr:hypothetical protein [Desulfomonile tiedjei]
MTNIPEVLFVGGFLGAGKTTAIRSLARILAGKGLKAAAITNDQATGLVDTVFLSGHGIQAEEVAGSCFCCNFNGLADAISHSIATAAPDVILAEPVGSCTDIVATVIRPMRALMKDKVHVLAYSVLVEPDRWTEIADSGTPWSIKYLFDKQLQEADFIVITKVDTLQGERTKEILEEVGRSYPESNALGISSKEGVGMEEWLNLVRATPPGERWLKEIDYQSYADAEAEMGWLNGMASVTLAEPVDGKMIGGRLTEMLAKGIADRDGRIGHLKLLVVGQSGSVKAGVTQIGEKPVLDGLFTGPVSHLEVTINIRATLSPGELSAVVNDSVTQFEESYKAEVDISAINTFRPGAPNPTHRYSA